MNHFFKELFEYNRHTNQKLIATLLQQPNKISEKSLKLMSHILNAHHIWNARIGQANPLYGVWQEQTVEGWMMIDNQNHENTFAILERDDLERMVDYTNTKGQPFNNKVRDILFHIINHSNYHRGQIASDMKLNGLEPIVSDYIFYKR